MLTIVLLPNDAPAQPVHALVEVVALPIRESAAGLPILFFEPRDLTKIRAQLVGFLSRQGAIANPLLDPVEELRLALIDGDPLAAR